MRRASALGALLSLALYWGVASAATAPSKPGAALAEYLRSEEQPLNGMKAAGEDKGKSWGLLQALAGFAVIACAAGATFLCVQFLKRRGGRQGSRKYLIEQLSYCPMGPKMGISLVKVGPELVLVGVTPNHISFLSAVPRLNETYFEESRYERGAFQEAVQEEVSRARRAGTRAIA